MSAFINAFRATSRGAFNRWAQEQKINENDASAYEAAKHRWSTFPFLLDPDLSPLCLRTAENSRGQTIGYDTPLTVTIWCGGATDTYNGKTITGSISDFVRDVLQARASVIATKRKGWVVTPTSNSDGHRINTSTTAMHALNLDCDGNGEWVHFLNTLDSLNYAYIAYQSGGWSPSSPKWHVLLPLARPFDTSSPDKIIKWKASYNTARVVFGSIGCLLGEGFDPTVETPCVPVFITERRSEKDPPREVRFRIGHTLDLEKLIESVPEIQVSETEIENDTIIEKIQLENTEIERIISALCIPMSKILNGRRDLYLALPGALLDRGIDPNDVLSVIEEVSLRCPGDPGYARTEVESKHREHVHCAQTTIRRYENGDRYTRVGVLAGGWPEVAKALDEVLNYELELVLVRLTAYWRSVRQVKEVRMVEEIKQKEKHISASEIRTWLLRAKRTKENKSKDPKTKNTALIKFQVILLTRILNKKAIDDRACDGIVTGAEETKVIEAAMNLIGSIVKVGTSFQSVLGVVGDSLAKTGAATSSVEMMRRAEKAFEEGMRTRHEWKKNKAAIQAAKEEKQRMIRVKAIEAYK